MRLVLTIILVAAGCSGTREQPAPPDAPRDQVDSQALGPLGPLRVPPPGDLSGLKPRGWSPVATLRSRNGKATNVVSIVSEEWHLYCTALRTVGSVGPTRFDVFVRKISEPVESHIISMAGSQNVWLENGPGDFEVRVVASAVWWIIEIEDAARPAAEPQGR